MTKEEYNLMLLHEEQYMFAMELGFNIVLSDKEEEEVMNAYIGQRLLEEWSL
jgi:hypothetical protein